MNQDYQTCMEYVKKNKKFPTISGSLYENSPYDEQNASRICRDHVVKKNSSTKERMLKYIMLFLVVLVIAYLVAAHIYGYQAISLNIPDIESIGDIISLDLGSVSNEQ